MINELRKLETIRFELENKIVMLSTENERKDGLLKSRNEEIERLREKCFKLEQANAQLPIL